MPEHQQIQQSREPKPTFQKQTALTNQNSVSHPVSIIQRVRINPKSLTSADVLQLQRTIGNRAVGRLLSEVRNSSQVQQVPIQRQEIPEEEEPLQGKFESKPENATCPSCVADPIMQMQEIPEEEEPLQGKFETIQRLKPEDEEKLQMKSVVQRQEIPEEEEPLQGKMVETIQRQEINKEEEPLQTKRENNTGMPDNLKAGVESLSGIDMSDVRVHYNSSKPAEVGALAYTQGTNIHVAPGQEKHLPHEAWHVVQQAQGRVRPTMQLKDGVPVNDDERLEYEADMMGAQTLVSATQLQNAPEEQKRLPSTFFPIELTGPNQGLLYRKKSRSALTRSDPANILYRLFSKSEDVIQGAFLPAKVNSKAHLRFGTTPADIRTDTKLGRAIPKNEKVIIDPVNQFVQHRKYIKDVTWIRAVDTRPDEWDPPNDKINGGYIRRSSTSPVVPAYPLPTSLDIFGESRNLEKNWHEDIGEYIIVEKSILTPSDDIVKINGVFKRMNAAYHVFDLLNFENAQVTGDIYTLLVDLRMDVNAARSTAEQLMPSGWRMKEIITNIHDSYQEHFPLHLLPLQIDQPKEEYLSPEAVKSAEGEVRMQEGGLIIPRQNFSMSQSKLRKIIIIFDNVMSNIKYDSSVVPLEFIRQVRETRRRIPDKPLSQIYKDFNLVSRELVEKFQASDCVGMAELVKARLEEIGVSSYVIGSTSPNYLNQLPDPKGRKESAFRVGWEQARKYAVFSHASVIVPFTDTKNMPHAIHIETGRGPDPQWFRLFSNWKQCLDRLERNHYDHKQVVNPSELAKKHIKCKWRIWFATDASQDKQAYIDLVEGAIWLGEKAEEGSEIASKFKGSKMNFEDVFKNPDKIVTINVEEKEIKLKNIDSLTLYLRIIKKEFGLADDFVENMLYLAENIAEFRQHILLSPITTLVATRTLRETVSREKERAIQRAGTKNPKVEEADGILQEVVTAVKQGNTEIATQAYKKAIEMYQRVESVPK